MKTSTDETWGELHVVSRGQLVQARTWHEGPSSRCSGVASPVLGLDVAHAREDMVIETGQGFDSTEWGRAYFHGPVETPHSLSHGGGPEIARRRPDEVKPPKERLGDQEVNTVQAGGPGGVSGWMQALVLSFEKSARRHARGAIAIVAGAESKQRRRRK